MIFLSKNRNNRDNKERFLSFLIKRGLYQKINKDIKVYRTIKINEIYNAYKLIYNRYLDKNLIAHNPLGIRIRDYEISKYNVTFIAKEINTISGVCGIIVDSDEFGLPSDKVYKNELNKLRKKSKSICEGTNQAMSKKTCQSSLITELLRCIFAYLVFKGHDKLIIEVSRCHKIFYELNYFKQIGPIKNYSNETFDPVILMCLDIKKVISFFNSIDDKGNSVDVFMKEFYYTQNPYNITVKKCDIKEKLQLKISSKLIELLNKQKDKHFKQYKKFIRNKLISNAFFYKLN